jgi:Isochorismatase family
MIRRTSSAILAGTALADGYRVLVVSDCSGGLTIESHEDAKRRLVQAGGTPIDWVGVVCEWAPDFTSDERHKVNPVVIKNGAGVGLALEQAFAQSLAGAKAPNTNAGGTDGETDRPREQVLRCVGQRP